jgi:hypothetical protein
MSHRKTLLKAFSTIGLILTLGASMSAYAGLFGFGGTSWKEEALLHDGSKIVVERSVARGGRHEIGQTPPYKEQSLSFSLPTTGKAIKWHDHYSEDIGTANFLPMLLDVVQDVPYLLVSPMGCLSYNKWGRPNPPYVIFKYEGEQWARIPLQELPSEISLPNLIISDPDTKVKKLGKTLVTADEIKRVNTGFKQPEFRSIVREPMLKERCPQYSSGPKAPTPIAPSKSPK